MYDLTIQYGLLMVLSVSLASRICVTLKLFLGAVTDRGYFALAPLLVNYGNWWLGLHL